MSKDIRSAALRLLSMREHTERELTDKLKLRGFSLEEITPLCEEFVRKDYLNERRLVESFFVSALHKRDKGSLRLRQELMRRGVNRELLDEMLYKYQSEVDESLVAASLASQMYARGKDRQYIERYLWRQGFSPSIVRATLNLDNEQIDS